MKDSKKYIFAKNTNRRNPIVSVIYFIGIVGLTCMISFASLCAGNYMATKGIFLVKIPSDQVQSTAKQINDNGKYSALFKVRDSLIEKFDGDVDDNALLKAAIDGMTDSLGDKYTYYMNEEEFNKLMKQSDSSINGIGVTVALKDNKVVIIEIVKGAPADRAGLLANDIIEKINDVDVSSDDLSKVVTMIAESSDPEIKLTIKRSGQENFDVKVVREKVKVESVKGNMINSSVGYIRIRTFMNEDTAEDFKTTIDNLKEQGMKGMILDLRENPGGLLSQGVGVASQFIPKGKIITYTIDKYENRNDSLSLGGDAEGMPLVILVNKNSASASEVVTGALRDYGAATIVGKTTFGKGIVQQPIKFGDGLGGLKVTISKYYTPNGDNIHNIGILPDFEVSTPVGIDEKAYDKNTDEQLKTAIQKINEKIK